MGYSSIMLGARPGGTSIARNAPCATTRSPTGSPPSIRRFSTWISAPISCRQSSRPARSGFSPTPSIRSREPGTSSAAASGNAAEDTSPGTSTSAPRSSGWPVKWMIRPSPTVSTATSAPKWRSMFSEWSRVASGSSTRVMPRAFSPASSTADFT